MTSKITKANGKWSELQLKLAVKAVHGLAQTVPACVGKKQINFFFRMCYQVNLIRDVSINYR